MSDSNFIENLSLNSKINGYEVTMIVKNVTLDENGRLEVLNELMMEKQDVTISVVRDRETGEYRFSIYEQNQPVDSFTRESGNLRQLLNIVTKSTG